MSNTCNHASIYLGSETRKKIDKYADEHDISRSAVIKIAVHKFLKAEEKT